MLDPRRLSMPATAATVDFADAQVDAALDRTERAFAPVHAGEMEMAKAMISLSSAAIAFTLALVQFVRLSKGPMLYPILLETSWTAFALVVVMGVLRFAYANQGQELRMGVEEQRGTMRTRLANLPPSPFSQVAQYQIMNDVFVRNSETVRRGIRISGQLRQAMFSLFVLGIFNLLAFAICNFPT
jgi:hypothetical protein